jgi:hypothetical protein
VSRNTTFRALHDLGLAAWFGGTLANAVALNPAAGQAGNSSRTGAVANVGVSPPSAECPRWPRPRPH